MRLIMVVLSAGTLLAAACRTQATRPPPTASKATTPAGPVAPPAPPRGPPPRLGSFGIDLAGGDPAVKPGDDFYERVNGGWQRRHELKPDEIAFGSMVAVTYQAEERVKAIIEELASRTLTAGTDEQRIADYYASYMDVAAANGKGLTPLAPILTRIAAIEDRDGLIDAFGRSDLDGSESPIAIAVELDSKNPDRHLIHVAHAGLGLPDRAYYLEEAYAEQRAGYAENVARLLRLDGMAETAARRAAARILELEIRIARHHWPRTDLRDRDKTYNPTTLERLERDVRGYSWRRHLAAAGIDVAAVEELVVMTPTALAPLAEVVASTPISTWKDYLTYHVIRSHAQLLGDEVDGAAFEFFGKKLAGQQEQRERWKRAVALISDSTLRTHAGLGEAVGRLYVARHFPPESKRMVERLVANLRTALRKRVQGLPWMGEETRRQALAKLDAFRAKIGYPDRWRDFSGIEIKRDDLVGNYQAVRRYWYEDQIQRLGRPTNREEWFMAPHAVNAYYNPPFNEVVFPAGILEPPFFDPHADVAVNYGSAGAVIGHEMGHGFDDQGSKSDAHGVLRNWWTGADRAAFEERTRALVAQYDGFEMRGGQHVNGQLTLGENIGDLGGLTVAYEALQIALREGEASVIDGLTCDQRFFMAWAQVWRFKAREAFEGMLLKIDVHSPARWRVNGVVRNMPQWYAAFGVQPGDGLYLAPEDRVAIW